METKFPFTKERLLALPVPASGRVTYQDTKVQGLQIRVTPAGTKSFCIYRRLKAGQPERVTLGKFPTMTVEQARKAATEVNAVIESGANPAEAKRAFKGEPTFQEVFDEYLKYKRKKNGTPVAERTKAEYQNLVRLYLAHIAPMKLSAITHEKVAQLSRKVGADAPIAANRMLAVVRAVFNYARDRRLYSGDNPAQGVRGFAETSRERFALSDELPQLFQAIADSSQRDYFLLALLTGARRSNVCEMAWRDLDLERGIWRLGMTKNGTSQNVTLSPEAVAVLVARKEGAGHSPYVFPGTGKTGHLVEPKKAWGTILAKSGISDFRIHDLRRTLGSWQAMTGASLAIIGKSLNHKTTQATAIYARLDLDPVRQSVNTATSAMLEAAGLKDRADVVALPKKGAA